MGALEDALDSPVDAIKAERVGLRRHDSEPVALELARVLLEAERLDFRGDGCLARLFRKTRAHTEVVGQLVPPMEIADGAE